MTGRHRRTLASVFDVPVRANVPWRSIEALLVAAGATIVEGAGFRITVRLNDVIETFHRPHPRKEAGP